MLPGWIKSIEDHGYIVDFGVEGKTGFLLRKNSSGFTKSYNRGKALCRGQVVQCLVLPGARARAIPVSINPSVVQETLLPGDTLVGLNALLPGMLVNAAVKEVRQKHALQLGFITLAFYKLPHHTITCVLFCLTMVTIYQDSYRT